MNLLIQPQRFEPTSIFFLDTKQNMMMVGNFTKMNYSTNHFTMIGLYLAFPILCADVFLQKSTPVKWCNKNLLYYYPNQNAELLKHIAKIEYEILLYYKDVCHIEKLSPSYQFYGTKDAPTEELDCIKYYREYSALPLMQQNPKYYIKISGIWENETEYGITYKVIEYHKKT